MSDQSDKVPVYIITGLLGAGKTTLLTHLLKDEHGLRFIVIQNELSEEMGIEAPMITQGAVDFYELPNGCVCCSAKSGLVSAIEASIEISRSRDQTQRIHGILVETTGVADPAGLVDVFWSGDYDDIVLSGVVCLVDATTVAELVGNLRWPELRPVFLKQIALADVVVLNKLDQLTSNISESIDHIAAINPHTQLWQSAFSRVNVADFLNINAFHSPPTLNHLSHHGHVHRELIKTVDHVFVKTPCLCLSKAEWTRRVGELLWTDDQTIFRCKGLVFSEGVWLSLQGVGDLFEFKPLDQAAAASIEDTANDRLLFVGINLDEAAIKAEFTSP